MERDGVTIGDELGSPVWSDELTPSGLSPLEVPCIETLTKPTDLLFFDPSMFHSSFGANLGGGGKRTYGIAVTHT
jgi:hypothetical protein